MNVRSLFSWRGHRGGVLRFPIGQQDDPLLVMLPPHLEALPVKAVVGSVGRFSQLDRQFRPLHGPSSRLRAIRQAMLNGATFPPIEVYRLHGLCYVVDGHHRVAAALDVGQDYLDALVTECLPRTAHAESQLEEARLRFALQTGLRSIAFSTASGYRLALAQVHEHRWYMGERGQRVDLRAAAEEWMEHVYQPVIRSLSKEHGPAFVAEHNSGDLYMQLCDYKYVASRERGHDIGFTQAIREWSAGHRRRSPLDVLVRLLGLTVVAMP